MVSICLEAQIMWHFLGNMIFFPLQERCETHSAEFVRKLLKNQIDGSYILGKMSLYVPSRHSRYNELFRTSRAKTNAGQSAPSANMMHLSIYNSRLLTDPFY